MQEIDDEEKRLRSVALQNAQSIRRARQRAEQELLQAKADLQKQSEWLRITLSSIGDAVIATDAEGRVTFMNGVAEALTGWPYAEAADRPVPDVFRIVNEHTRLPVENPAVLALCKGVVAGQANHTVLIARDGRERPIDDSAAPMCGADGATVGAVLIFRDVTQRKQAEEAQARLGAIVESSDDAIIGKTLEGVILSWNAGAERLFGYTAKEAIGQPITLIVPPERLDEERAILNRVRHGERVEHFETIRVSRDGHHLDISLTVSPIRDDQGHIVGASKIARDITERKRAENALRESEARYRAIVEATPECVKLVGSDGTLLQMNPAGLAMVEADAAGDALGKCVYNLIAPEHRDAFRQFNERICRGAGGSFEFDVVGLKGTRRHMESNSVPLAAPDGGFAQLAVTRDVTERRQAETVRQGLLREVEAERRRLEQVFQMAPSFMCVLRGPAHVFERANERYYELLGRPDLIGRPVREAVPEMEGQGFVETLDRVYQTGEPFVGKDIKIMLHRGSGSLEERFLEFVYQPLRDPEGAVSGILVHGIDLTERKRAEAELRESEARYRRAALEAAQAAQANAKFRAFFEQGTNFAGVLSPDGTVVEANRLCLDACGFTRDEVLGKPFWECGWWNRSPALVETVRTATLQAAGGELFRAEITYFLAGGAERVVDLILAPVTDAAGRILFVAATGTDVTERKQMEDTLRESDRKKDDFIALLAHELRNPLAPIRNGLQVMRLAGGDVNAVAQARAMMDRQLSHMVRLIDDLLDVSRISRNKMELRRERVLLADVVSTAVETARPLIDAERHDLTVSLPQRPVYLDADLTRLAQVFGNLLTNSAKYTKRGGRIWISAERRGGEVAVSVRDTGIGIPAEAMANIFDMFSQVDRSVERSTGGLGIGLALVKGLVEMHGGSVAAESAGLGQGSTFTVRLPALIDRPAPAAAALDIGQAAARPRRRILVVDDNRDGADSLAMMLGFMNNEVQTANDGIEALEAAERFLPEVILMDVGMPRLNGLNATQRIRQQPWGRSMTIVALTGWGQEGDRERSQEAGCDYHLVKPVNLADLEKLLEELQASRES